MNSFSISARWLIVLVLLAFGLVGCATMQGQPELAGLRDKELYDMGRSAIAASDFHTAVTAFETLSSRDDTSGYTTHALLELAYAHYKTGKHELGLDTVDRYVTTTKQRNLLDYAYYLKGIIYLDQATLLAQQPNSNLQDATTAARQAYTLFSDLISHFPNSKYTASASRHMGLLRESLAGFEIRVARQWLVKGDYVNAAERARYVLENYPDTPAVNDAIRLLRDISASTGENAPLPALPPETRPLPDPPAIH